MLQKNGINFTELVETARLNDVRKKVDWNRPPNQERFIQPVGAQYEYNTPIITNFQHKGNNVIFAQKGTIPTFLNRRFETSTPGTLYLEKFTNKKLCLCNTLIKDTSLDIQDSDSRIVQMIGKADEDLQYIFIEMCGGGSAGHGGNFVTSGTGGAGGGYLLLVMKISTSAPIQFNVGKGGEKTKGTTLLSTMHGTPTELIINNTIYYAAGQGIASTGTNPNSAKDNTVLKYANSYVIQNIKGQPGVASGNTTITQQEFTYSPYGSIIRGNFITESGWGGAGGNSLIGAGGHGAPKGGAGYNDAFDAQGPGGGGGGACVHPQKFSGNGGPGYLAIYY